MCGVLWKSQTKQNATVSECAPCGKAFCELQWLSSVPKEVLRTVTGKDFSNGNLQKYRCQQKWIRLILLMYKLSKTLKTARKEKILMNQPDANGH